MKIATYGRDEVEKLFDFNDENGKYYLKGTDFTVTINSWNNLVDVYFDSTHLSPGDIKLLHKIFTTLYFQKDDNNE